MFVNTLDLDIDQKTLYDKLTQNTVKFQKAHILFLATVEKGGVCNPEVPSRFIADEATIWISFVHNP